VLRDSEQSQLAVVRGLEDVLPAHWEYQVRTTDEASSPEGLSKPEFQLDFSRSDTTFLVPGPRALRLSAALRLYFYPIEVEETVVQAVNVYVESSGNPPILFAKTESYIVVTTPSDINHGVSTEGALALYQPLERVLKEFFGDTP